MSSSYWILPCLNMVGYVLTGAQKWDPSRDCQAAAVRKACAALDKSSRHGLDHGVGATVVNATCEQDAELLGRFVLHEDVELALPEQEARTRPDVAAAFPALEERCALLVEIASDTHAFFVAYENPILAAGRIDRHGLAAHVDRAAALLVHPAGERIRD